MNLVFQLGQSLALVKLRGKQESKSNLVRSAVLGSGIADGAGRRAALHGLNTMLL